MGEIKNKQQYRNSLDKFQTQKMELLSKHLEQIVFKRRHKIEEHMLIVMNESIHEEHLSQPLQTKNIYFKLAIASLTGYDCIFNVTNTIIKFYFKKTVTNEEDFIQITIPPGAYEIQSLNKEVGGLLSIKIISPNQNIFSQSNQNFQH